MGEPVMIDDGPVSTPWGGLGMMIAFFLIVGGLTIAWQSGQAVTLGCEGTTCTARRTWLGIIPLGPTELFTDVTGASVRTGCVQGSCDVYFTLAGDPPYETTIGTLEGGRYAASTLNSYLNDGAAGSSRVSTLGGVFIAQRLGLLVLPMLLAGGAVFAFGVRKPRGRYAR